MYRFFKKGYRDTPVLTVLSHLSQSRQRLNIGGQQNSFQKGTGRSVVLSPFKKEKKAQL
jgi:hypothetical protein